LALLLAEVACLKVLDWPGQDLVWACLCADNRCRFQGQFELEEQAGHRLLMELTDTKRLELDPA